MWGRNEALKLESSKTPASEEINGRTPLPKEMMMTGTRPGDKETGGTVITSHSRSLEI